MSRNLLVYYEDILVAIKNIETHLQGKLDFKLFSENITVHSAVERELLVIGEATNRILKVNPEIVITAAVKIVRMRNKMIHEYDIIDDAQIWNVIVNHLPLLKKEIEELLSAQ